MISRYTAVALQTTMFNIAKPSETKRNIDHIARVIQFAYPNASWEAPVKLICLGEQCLQGFSDTRLNLGHVKTARELMCTTIPGEETDKLGEICQQYRTYICGNLRGVEPEFKDRYFNMAFIVSPEGKVVHKYHKLHFWPGEPSCSPHDLYDMWVKLYGRKLESFFPVADLEIGKIGTLICADGSYPESFRGLAMNGAEIITRPSYPTRGGDVQWFELQNRAAALDNNCYVIGASCNLQLNMFPGQEAVPIAIGEGIHIFDYKGGVLAKRINDSDGYCAGIIDLPALRDFRANAAWGNFIKDLRTELYQLIYEQPIFPKNRYLTDPNTDRAARVELFKNQARKMIERGVYKE